MDIVKFAKATIDYFKYLSDYPSGYTQQKDFISLVQNNNSVLELLVQELWQPSKELSIGQVIWSPNMPKNTIAVVTTSGTTDSTEPGWGAGNVYDGTVIYVMREKAKMSKVALLDFYPIGTIYISADATSPDTLFGGEWKKLDNGRSLRSTDGVYSAGTEIGEATHILTTNELPSHSHGGTIGGGSHSHTASSNSTGAHTHTITNMYYKRRKDSTDKIPGYGSGNTYMNSSSAGAHSHTITVATSASHSHTFTGANIGGGQAHNNMQPWRAVYMWERIA